MTSRPIVPAHIAVFALLLGAASAAGCSRFELLYPEAGEAEGDSETSADVGGDIGELDAGPDVSELDAVADAVDAGPEDAADVPDADLPELPPDLTDVPDAVAADAAGDVGDVDGEDGEHASVDGDAADLPPDAPDVPDLGPDLPPACEDECLEHGLNRCALDGSAALERCLPDAADGCLVWQPHTECAGGDPCAGQWACADGVCMQDAGTAVVCPPTGDPCQPSTCDPVDGGCKVVQTPTGGGCDDDDPCTVLTTCTAEGACLGLPSASDCPCGDDGDCLQYDDGDLCNGYYQCVNTGPSSACVAVEAGIICPAPADPCLMAVCDPSDGQCKLVAGADGVDCVDEDLCTEASICDAGECTGTAWLTCPEVACATGTCVSPTGACDYEYVAECCGNAQPEGAEQCDDGDEEDGDGCDADCYLSDCATRALAFGGAGCVRADGLGLMPSMAKVTIEFFIRPSPATQGAWILDRQKSPGTGDLDWHLELNGPDGFQQLLWVEGRQGLDDLVVGGPTLVSGQWQHVALTRNLGGGTGTITWWLDGKPAGVEVPEGIGDLGSAEELWIGCHDGLVSHLDGDLDELRISDGIIYSSSSGFPVPSFPFAVTEKTGLLYHFDHTAPGTAVDASAFGKHGLWHGQLEAVDDDPFEQSELGKPSCATTWCDRAALLFEPAAEGVAVLTDATPLDEHQALTIELLVRVDQVVPLGQHVIVGRDANIAGAPDWHVSVVGDSVGTPRMRWTEGQIGGLDNSINSATTLTIGTWHHVAVIRDVPEGGGDVTVRWFIDGTAESPKVLSGSLALAATEPLALGSNQGSSGFYSGALDELRISPGALYGSDFGVPSTFEARHDTLGLWHFDAAEGTSAYPALPSALGAFQLEGVEWASQDAPWIAPCPAE